MNSKFWMTFVVRIDLVQCTLGLSGNFNPRLVSPKYLRYIFVSLCSDNSLHLNPRLAIPKLQRARKLPPPVKSRHAKCPWYPWTERTASNRWGYFHNLPHISDKRVPKPCFPTPIPSAHPFVHRGRENPRSPTPSSVRHPAGASSPTTSSIATPRRPSSTVPDEDPSSISSSRRFSHPVLHLQGAPPTFPSSFAPPPFPHCRLHLHHRKSIIITVSSDEAVA